LIDELTTVVVAVGVVKSIEKAKAGSGKVTKAAQKVTGKK
jgi:hypothetical protein